MMLNRTLRSTLAVATLVIALTGTFGVSLSLHMNVSTRGQARQLALDEPTATPTATPDGGSTNCIGCSGGGGGPR
jgi:hypothetical protein